MAANLLGVDRNVPETKVGPEPNPHNGDRVSPSRRIPDTFLAPFPRFVSIWRPFLLRASLYGYQGLQ
jgi:hypothetical protein